MVPGIVLTQSEAMPVILVCSGSRYCQQRVHKQPTGEELLAGGFINIFLSQIREKSSTAFKKSVKKKRFSQAVRINYYSPLGLQDYVTGYNVQGFLNLVSSWIVIMHSGSAQLSCRRRVIHLWAHCGPVL